MINIAEDGNGYNFGSASVRATRMTTHGFYVPKRQDGEIYSMEVGGDGVLP